MSRPCHVERVAGVPVLVSGELSAADRAEVADLAGMFRALVGTGVLLTRRVRRLGGPCDQCTGFEREHADDCPEAAL